MPDAKPPISCADLRALSDTINIRALIRRAGLNHNTVGKVISGTRKRELHLRESRALLDALKGLEREVSSLTEKALKRSNAETEQR